VASRNHSERAIQPDQKSAHSARTLNHRQRGTFSRNQIMKFNPPHSVSIAHETVELDVTYERFIKNFENILGRFDPAVATMFADNPLQADEAMKQMEGEQNLMIFSSQDHGALLLLAGQTRKAVRYILGNPRVALQMTQHDVRAGLYVPLSVLVYEVSENAVLVEFDRPSSLLGQFKDPKVTDVARGLDVKLARIIEKAAQLSQEESTSS